MTNIKLNCSLQKAKFLYINAIFTAIIEKKNSYLQRHKQKLMYSKLTASCLVMLFLCIGNITFSQATTGAISGKIVDVNKVEVSYANVVLTNLETNEQNISVSQDNGTYTFLNITPAIYEIKVSYVGYENYSSGQIMVKLSQEVEHDIMMLENSSQLDQVVITSKSINNGGSYTVQGDQIDATPTLFRSVQELTRSNPENNLNSFQGASHRFNNLNIDGVATNDIIGFQEPASGAAGSQANGTPGSLAKTQPIGFGAIKELSVKTVPFDLSIGNFNGANIDIITKNGTNNFEHKVFGFLNNQILSGKRIDDERLDIAQFSDYQVGFNSGGPLIKDKLFYFANVEFARSSIPLQNEPGSVGSSISSDEVQQVRDHLMSKYGYDPGAFAEAQNVTQSTKVFARLDYVINNTHKLTFRNNYVNGFADNLEWSANIFNFGNQGFRHNNFTNSSVLELKSNYSNVFNKLNIGFNRVEEGRTFEGDLFPHIQIATSSAARIFAGTYREASVFNSDFNTFQILDKLSVVRGNHSLSAGFLFQFHDVNYGFLSAWNGRWEYSSLENFLNDRPSRVRGVYNVDPSLNNFDFVQENPSASIGVIENAFYAQDRWSISDNTDIHFGLRIDGQFLTRQLPISEAIQNSDQFTGFTNELNNNYQFNPRASIHHDFGDSGFSIDFGSGLYSGKLPYLWFAYIDYISGTDYFNIDIRPDEQLDLTANAGELVSLQPGLTEVNLLDPDFRFPRDWKTNISLNWRAPQNWNFGFDFTYTDVVQGLVFQSINRNEVFDEFNGSDNRIFYNTSGDEELIDQGFTNIFVLSNTDQGFRYNATFKAEKTTKRTNSYFGYSYGVSKDVSSTVRSSPAANYEWNQAVFGNDPNISFSNYDLRHKVNYSQTYSQPIGDNKNLSLSLLYNGRSGTPFTFVYQGDLNNDGSSRNDLIYVPSTIDDVQLVEINDANGNPISVETQWQQLDEYINSIDYLNENRGNIVERNGGRTPWNHSLDANAAFTLPYRKGKNIAIRANVFNVLNLVNPNWGKQYFVPNVVNSSFSLLRFQGITNDLEPQFSFNIPIETRPWVVDNLNSRWRIQVGLEIDL